MTENHHARSKSFAQALELFGSEIKIRASTRFAQLSELKPKFKILASSAVMDIDPAFIIGNSSTINAVAAVSG